MLDMIGAIGCTAVYALLAGILIGLSPAGGRTKAILSIAAAAWGALIVAVAALGGFAPGAAEPVPAVAFAFAAWLALLIGAWLLVPGFREALSRLPLPALVGVNATRLVGVLFLLLAAEGRLSAPFAPSAGGGDIAVGALAIPLAALAATAGAGRAGWTDVWIGAWNALGVFDLVVAIGLGVLSAPGTPFRVFMQEPGTAAMGSLPWIMVPAMLVPVYLLIHLAIAARLRAHRHGHQAAAMVA